MIRSSLCAFLAFALATPALAAEAAHPTSAELVQLHTPADLALSPDGRQVVYTVATATFDSSARVAGDDTKTGWKRERQVFVTDIATQQTRQLTRGDALASAPCWSPDGRTIAFLRNVGEHAAIHLMSLGGGEPRRLDTGELDPASIAFSPDGAWLGFLAEEPLEADEKQLRHVRGGAIHWEFEFPETHLHRIAVAGGVAQMVPGTTNVVAYEWAPDSKRVALVTSANGDPYLASSVDRVSVVQAADGSFVSTLDLPEGPYTVAHWSPDGHSILAPGLQGGLSNVNALYVADAATGKVRDLVSSADLGFAAASWSADSKSVVAVVRRGTATTLERFAAAAPGTGTPLGFSGRVISGDLVTAASSPRLAFLSSTDRTPDQVTVFDPAPARTLVVTDLDPQVATWPLGTTRVVRWKNAEGVNIEGVLTLAPGAHEGAPAPIIVMPHGGPDDVTTTKFSALAQYFASRGYSVLRPNYRGSFGYGFDFYAANRNRFGEIEQADIESGVDQLIRDGLADPKQLYFGGWSWGGYITTWMVTHVHRYRAAVAGAAVSDVMHSYSLSDINHGLAAQWEYKGDPWSQLSQFDRPNPIRYVKDCTTPLLLLHGQADTRVPFSESVQFYRALKDLGRSVQFYAYPRENHSFVEPAHRVDYVKRWADWYDAIRSTPDPVRTLP